MMALFPKRVVAWERVDAAVEEALLTTGGRARRVVQSMIDLAGQGGSGGSGLSAADRAAIVAYRSRTDADEQAPTATNWGPRPSGFGCVVAVGASPAPADAGPLDLRIDRDAASYTEVVTTFSGADGSAWPAPWTVERVPAGGGASVSGGKGWLTTGSLGSSALEDQVAARYGGADYADVNVLLTFRHTTTAARPRLVLRSDVANLSAADGARVVFEAGVLQVHDVVAGTASIAAQATKSLTVGADYRLRVAAAGDQVQARVWPLADAEPASWDVTGTVTKTAPGYLGLVVAGTSSTTGAAQVVGFDDIEVTATASGGYGVNYGVSYGG